MQIYIICVCYKNVTFIPRKSWKQLRLLNDSIRSIRDALIIASLSYDTLLAYFMPRLDDRYSMLVVVISKRWMRNTAVKKLADLLRVLSLDPSLRERQFLYILGLIDNWFAIHFYCVFLSTRRLIVDLANNTVHSIISILIKFFVWKSNLQSLNRYKSRIAFDRMFILSLF